MTPDFIFKQSPKSICVLRLSAIGDVCHMVSVVQSIQRRHPAAAITWIIGKQEAKLVQDLPGIEFIIFDKKQGIRAYFHLYQQLKQKQFEVLLHAQVALRASLASLFIRAKYRVGFDKARAKDGQWLFTNRRIREIKKQHVLEGLHEFARCLDAVDDTPSWSVPISPESRAFAKSTLPEGPILIINPCASVPQRNWTIAGYAAIADFAASELDMTVVLTGGPSSFEIAFAEQIIQASSAPIINLVGKTTLKQCLALLDRASVVIGPDTGTLHMATMLQKPIIGLYAASNPERTGPYLSLQNTVNAYPAALKQYQQQTVDQVPFGKRVHDEKVMELITVQQVREKLNQLQAAVNPTAAEKVDTLF